MFQSPSRGGHLCGPVASWRIWASPDVDVSVPFTRGTPLWLSVATRATASPCPFQSPSRGGHLCGQWCQPVRRVCFSPLHEGDTSVASPLHEGDTSCFSPLHEGDTSVACRCRHRLLRFQSPSRGGHLCGARLRSAPAWPEPVSVPFTRGTPLWPTFSETRIARGRMFQSPSRGGHLCGSVAQPRQRRQIRGFSPLHEGDTSVADHAEPFARLRSTFQSPSRGGHLCGSLICRSPALIHCVSVPFARGTPLWLAARQSGAPGTESGFSPLREGDTSVANALAKAASWRTRFSPLREGDTSVAVAPIVRAAQVGSTVSVPFARGTPPWLHTGHPARIPRQSFQSPSRGGHLRGYAGASPPQLSGILPFQSPSRGGHLRGS